MTIHEFTRNCTNRPASLIAMIPDSKQPPHQSRQKCASCGLVNAGSDELCRRCGGPLMGNDLTERRDDPEAAAEASVKKRGLLTRLTWIAGATLICLLICYVSLLITSDGLPTDQRDAVQKAIPVLDQHASNPEPFISQHLTAFRSTDN